jgi:tetratricopeptide (TPR) repeat protein
MNSTKLSAFCDRVLETCWLLAVIITPLFFNTASNNVFERDKWTTLRTVALIMAAVWAIRFVEERVSGKQQVLRISWRTPLVLPILLTIVSYLISSAFSLTPYVSIFGGYQRLRGTLSILSCITICLIIFDRMRTREQVDRFISVVILNSLPIALYGFIQHNELDPLPWGGDVTRRIASNMGNPIFVAAYMIMAALPTLARIVDAFRSILTDEDTGTADVLRAAAYIFMFLVQVISIWYSGSRGPLMGLVAGLGLWMFVGLLTLQQAARRENPFQPGSVWKDLGRGAAFGIGSLAAAVGVAAGLYFASRAILVEGSGSPQWIAAGGALLALFATWMVFVINRKGWRWLWISALIVGILFVVFFFLINLVFVEWSQTQPWLGRLDDVLRSQGGTTGKVRDLIWQGSMAMSLPHEPIEFPPLAGTSTEWQPDKFNFLRPIVGHGPESMYVAYNRFYPPLLGHYESRTATPDRSHNETLDTLVITGVLGCAAYLWLFGGIFYFGLHWLGFIPDDWRRIVFFALLVVGALATVLTVSFIPSLGPHFFGLAIPVGMVAALFVYLTVYGFSAYRNPETVPAAHPYAVLLTGILSAVVAHFIELQFAFSCAANRTTFWALMGALVVIGAGLVRKEEAKSDEAKDTKPAKRRRRRRQSASRSLPAWLGPTLSLSIIGGFILGTMAFDFVISPAPDDPYFTAIQQELQGEFSDPAIVQQELQKAFSNPVTIIRRTLTVLSNRTQAKCTARWNVASSECVSYGMFMIFAFTWVMSAVVLIAQMAKRGAFRERKDDWLQATVWYLLLSLAVGLGFALMLASHYGSRWRPGVVTSVPDLARFATAPMAHYYIFIVFGAIAGGAALLLGKQQLPRQTAHSWGIVTLVVMAVLVGYLATKVNLQPIQADVIYKLALSLEPSEAQADLVMELYDLALDITPQEDFFYFEKGRVLLKQGWTQAGIDQAKIQSGVETFLEAQEIAPLNADHTKGLAQAHQVWGMAAAQAGDEAAKTQHFQLAEHYHDITTRLSPNNAFLWDMWVRFYLQTENYDGAQKTVSRSLAVDDAYDETWMLQAEIYRQQGLFEEAAAALARVVELKPKRVDGWLALGDAYIKQELFAEAAGAYEQVTELKPEDPQGWVGLGEAYAGLGDWSAAASAFETAVGLDPSVFKAWWALGSGIYPQLARFDEAIFALQRSLELPAAASRAWEVYRALAINNIQLGQRDEAVANAQLALELAPDEQKAELEALLSELGAEEGD